MTSNNAENCLIFEFSPLRLQHCRSHSLSRGRQEAFSTDSAKNQRLLLASSSVVSIVFLYIPTFYIERRQIHSTTTMSESSEEEFSMKDDGDEEEEEEEEGEEQEEEEEGDRKRSARKSIASYAEDSDNDDDDDDSEDDIPLSQLAASAKKTAKKPATNGKKKTPAKKAAASKKAPAPARKSSNVSTASSSGDKTYRFPSAALYQTESLKGLLIQRLLCRWWYAYQWPDPASLPAKPPKNYDALGGYTGVYVCTSGDNVGKIKDLRDKSQCPSFANFASKPASELKELLLKALQNQQTQLIEHEGEGTAQEKELKEMIKWTTKLDPAKADKEAVKVLKASKLKL